MPLANVTQWWYTRSFMTNSPNFADPEDIEVAPADENSFGDILSQFEQEHHVAGKETIQGTVVSITAETVFVDIGRKMDGVIPIEKVRHARRASLRFTSATR